MPFFFFMMSLSVQWIICSLLANVMPLLTGLTGSQSHTMQNRSWTWLWRSCSSCFVIFHTGGDVIMKTGKAFSFLLLRCLLSYPYEKFFKYSESVSDRRLYSHYIKRSGASSQLCACCALCACLPVLLKVTGWSSISHARIRFSLLWKMLPQGWTEVSVMTSRPSIWHSNAVVPTENVKHLMQLLIVSPKSTFII